MGKCSYTLSGLTCPEATWRGSEKYCIFHDPSPEKDIELFRHELKLKFDKKDYAFRGYSFPEEMNFRNWKFEENADFSGATFQRGVDFIGATFQDVNFMEATFQRGVDFMEATFQDVNFIGATFQENSIFGLATFQKDVYFTGATFQKDSIFSGATFQEDVFFTGATFQEGAYFDGATFEKDAVFNLAVFQNANFYGATFQKDVVFTEAIIERNLEFIPRQINKLDLRYAQFLFKGHITANLTETRFYRADLENVAFTGCKWPKKIYEEIYMDDEMLTFKSLETIYRNLKQSMQRHGDYSKAGDFYYKETECRKKAMREKRFSLNWFKSFGHSLLKYTCGYGEKPERTALSSLLTVLVFAFLYWFLGCLQYPMRNPTPLEQIGSTLYFSFVTFTTLGLGDIEPINFSGRALICCEAVIGAFLIALFVVVFARKMTR